jgi:uncharacterized protein YdeI (BOF family)
MLHGKIVGQLDRGLYVVSDGTGEVMVQTLMEEELSFGTEVDVTGEVDKNSMTVLAQQVGVYPSGDEP